MTGNRLLLARLTCASLAAAPWFSAIWYDTKAVVCLDGSRSSQRPDVWLRPPERTVAKRAPGELLRLRVFTVAASP